jgi:hypothetical protein
MVGVIENIEGFLSEIEKVIIDLCKDRKEFIIELQREQLWGGKDGDGEKIRPPYAASTIKRKRRLGQPTDRVTWKDKGDLYNSIDVKFREREFELVTDDRKAKYLFRRYGKNVFGLNEDSREKLRNDMNEELRDYIKKKLLGR